MGFFLCDVHRRIEYIQSMKPFDGSIVYRGQAMRDVEFKKKIRDNVSGLLSFNNFLSTTPDYYVAKMYAESNSKNPQQTIIGILFEMNIDETISSALFAALDGDESQFAEHEKEVLFSMHTIFRIVNVNKEQERLWRIQLKLTSDQDEELMHLGKKIRREIRGNAPWYRLSYLLAKMGKFNDAIDVLLELLNTVPKSNWEFHSYIYHQLGFMYREKGKYDIALKFYNQALTYAHHIIPLNHKFLGITYNDIGEVYREQGNHLEALKYYQQTLKYFEKSFQIEP